MFISSVRLSNLPAVTYENGIWNVDQKIVCKREMRKHEIKSILYIIPMIYVKLNDLTIPRWA